MSSCTQVCKLRGDNVLGDQESGVNRCFLYSAVDAGYQLLQCIRLVERIVPLVANDKVAPRICFHTLCNTIHF